MIKVSRLRLDPDNPRLPEPLQGADQEELLQYLYENTAIDELATSFVDNRFFAHEPLIVSKADAGGSHTVLEGNRRLAALTILLQLETARAVGIEFAINPVPTPDQLSQLGEVPCLIVENPQDVHRFLGFRHIGGIKTWSAEAKARYLLAEVGRAHAESPDRNAFTTVARAVGSNAQGIRNPYIAIRILIYAREQFGIDISEIQQHRFGVWNRAMNSRDLRNYIGFGSARTFEEVEGGLQGLREANLREVLRDMTPLAGSNRAVLGDSREVTIYAQVLTNERARKVLREHDDLGLARQVVDQASLPQRIRRLVQSIEVLNREVERQGAPSDARGPARELVNLSRSLLALVELDDIDDD